MSFSLTKKYALGVYGDGQLARLLAQKALKLNISTLLYTLNQEKSPCKDLVPLYEGKNWDDEEAFKTFALQCETVSLENEFVPTRFLEWAEDQGIRVIPNAGAYDQVSNKLKQVQLAERLSIKVPEYQVIHTPDDLVGLKLPVMLKSLSGGYDGYGNFLYSSESEQEKARMFIHTRGAALAQEFIAFEKEVAVIVASDGSQAFTFPVVETVQEHNICHFVITPPRLAPALIEQIENEAKALIKTIQGKGVFGVEFFVSKGQVIFNEIAPRPHNSGHYSIEACDYSQFDVILKLLQGETLTAPRMMTKAAGMLNLLGTRNAPAIFEGDERFHHHPKGKLHLYGKKDSRIGRKMGHFTLQGENSEDVLRELAELKSKYQL